LIPVPQRNTLEVVNTKRIVQVALVVVGAFNLGLGLWAMLGARSFFDALASDFDPFNAHLIHDIGAFMAGLGVTALLALVWSDGWSVALGGNAFAALAHLGTHLADRDTGATLTDPFGLALFAAFVVAVLAKLRFGSTGLDEEAGRARLER
jgi:hypothetical protein